MKKIIVLGGGMVGAAMAADLQKDNDVTVADLNTDRLKSISSNYGLKTVSADLSDPVGLKKTVAGFDLVIGAVPGYLGFNTLKNVIEAGKDVVDISFFGEDPFELNALAESKGVTAVVDCGVAPGMSNLILGHHNKNMSVDSFECLVGGLPVKRIKPYEYKAPFSPVDVIEEYTRPARMVENGNIVVKPALSEPELIDLEPVGTLEAFNSDGLRSLLKTMSIKNMKEKTLRYPGHSELMRILSESGFFRTDKIEINGAVVSPVDVTAKLLFDKWKLQPGEKEFTVMRITISGKENNKHKKYDYNLYDDGDPADGISSMARTTGYTCTAVARLVLNGDYIKKGISPPEFVGASGDCYNKVISMLKLRGVNYSFREEYLS